jgi:hypothetical protein
VVGLAVWVAGMRGGDHSGDASLPALVVARIALLGCIGMIIAAECSSVDASQVLQCVGEPMISAGPACSLPCL